MLQGVTSLTTDLVSITKPAELGGTDPRVGGMRYRPRGGAAYIRLQGLDSEAFSVVGVEVRGAALVQADEWYTLAIPRGAALPDVQARRVNAGDTVVLDAQVIMTS